jgi:hypothetical protein
MTRDEIVESSLVICNEYLAKTYLCETGWRRCGLPKRERPEPWKGL